MGSELPFYNNDQVRLYIIVHNFEKYILKLLVTSVLGTQKGRFLRTLKKLWNHGRA